MVQKTRCRFECRSAESPFEGADPSQLRIRLEARYDQPLTEEEEAFSKYTPYGEMEFGIDNPALEGFFKPGQDYYIDIIPVEPGR